MVIVKEWVLGGNGALLLLFFCCFFVFRCCNCLVRYFEWSNVMRLVR